MTSYFAAQTPVSGSSTTFADGYPRLLVLIATVGTGVCAGVFFAFSSFVMAGLRRLPPAQGLAAMQAINKTAVTPLFMTALFGTALVTVATVVLAVRDLSQPAARLVLIGAAAYLVLVIGLTIVYHVPHNDSLAALDPNAPGSAAEWLTYARDWTRWNHLRTAGGVLSAVMYALALRVR